MKHLRSSARLLPMLALAVPAVAQTELTHLDGPHPGAWHFITISGGDINGDGFDDLIVGAPLSSVGAPQAGSLYAYSGADHSVLWERHHTFAGAHFGWSLARTENGWLDVTQYGDTLLVGAPEDEYQGVVTGRAYYVRTSDGALLNSVVGTAGDQTGYAVAWADLGHVGQMRAVVSVPGWDSPGVDAGAVWAQSGAPSLWTRHEGLAGERFGTTMVAGHFDLTGDGFVDLAVGAPDSNFAGPGRGRVQVYINLTQSLSYTGEANGDRAGTALATRPQSAALDALLIGEPFNDESAPEAGRVRAFLAGVEIDRWNGASAHDLFGSSLARTGDLDGDGVEDWIAGAMQLSGPTVGVGYARALSGSSGNELWTVHGALAGDQFGRTVAGAGDFNGDGAPDVAVGSLLSSSFSRGRVQLFSGRCGGTVNYCTAGTSASGCTPVLSTFGAPSASAAAGFVVQAWPVEGAKNGIFFFGIAGRQATPWGNGTSFQCVKAPVWRAGLVSGSGTAGSCSGLLSQDINALWHADPSKNPGAFALVQLQGWYRDPANPSNRPTSLTDALELIVCP